MQSRLDDFFRCRSFFLLPQVPGCISSGSIRLHASNPNLSTTALGNEKTDSESLESHSDVAKLQEDFSRVATSCELKLVYLFHSLRSCWRLMLSGGLFKVFQTLQSHFIESVSLCLVRDNWNEQWWCFGSLSFLNVRHECKTHHVSFFRFNLFIHLNNQSSLLKSPFHSIE